MKIIGTGVDLVEVPRFEQSARQWGKRFLSRIFTAGELAYASQHKAKAQHLAVRFAAKEAVVKAMGTGFAHGMWIRDVGVVQDRHGKPEIVWSARGERLRRKLGIGAGHVTLTDEAGLVVAVAILMAVRPARAAGKPRKGGRR